uniref:Fe2OG dioxygenase domain-containing protein n=1 Tax=Panagrolaimus sp. ES5 TaxID=591445 RepID=A0AC34FJ07_9BILA
MREMFNYYKSKDADLTKVKDLTVSHPAEGIICQPVAALSKNLSSAFVMEEELKYGLKDYNDWNVTTIADRPGLYILHNIFKPESHLEWVHKAINTYCRPPNFTNINQNGSIEEGKNFNLKKLRWATLGFDYDWTAKVYPETPRASLPDEFVYVCEKITEALGLQKLSSDTSIVNYYPLNTRLSPHVDRSERDYSYPLVSLSFGQSAIYVSGGASANDEPIPIMLHSGDVLVMAGAQRLVFHGVPRILKTRNFQIENDSSNFTVAEKKALLQYINDHRTGKMLKVIVFLVVASYPFVSFGHPLMRIANTALASLSTIPLEMPPLGDAVPCEIDVDCRRTFNDPMTFCFEGSCIRN